MIPLLPLFCKVREPQKAAIFRYEGTFYQLLALTFNLAKIEKGRFGNEMKLYIGRYEDPDFGETDEYRIDVLSANVIMGKQEHNDTPIKRFDTTAKGLKRNWELQLFANYNEKDIETTLLEEIMTLTFALNQKYKIKMVQLGTFDYEYFSTVNESINKFETSKSNNKSKPVKKKLWNDFELVVGPNKIEE